jgi:hypothetical protein
MNPALRILVFASVASMLLPAQGTPPKAKVSEYPVHASLDNGITLGAEYLVHAIPTSTGSQFTTDYLVVEVAFFSSRLTPVNLSSEHFLLRVNGQRVPLMTQSAGIVAASIKYPDWTDKARLVGTAGVGNAQVIFGQPQPVERFPGDPNARPLPTRPRAPEPENPTGEATAPPIPIEEQIERASLPTGDHVLPVSGVIFFPFRGKIKSLRSLELLYDGPAGKITLKLL